MTDYGAVLTARFAGSQWALNGDDYEGLTWLSDDVPPTRAELDALWPEVQAELALAVVHRSRQAAYQVESDPLFFAAQRGDEGVSEADWLAKVAEIKQRFPLP